MKTALGVVATVGVLLAFVDAAVAQRRHPVASDDPFGDADSWSSLVEESPGFSMRFADDDPDLTAILQSNATPMTPGRRQALARLRAMLGGRLSRQPAQVMQALIDRNNDPAPLTIPQDTAPPAQHDDTEAGDEPSLAEDAASEEDAFEEDIEEEEMAGAPTARSARSPLASRVLVGDWNEVKEFLAGLPKDEGPEVYGELLSMLVGDAAGVILPQEILALAGAAPGALDERNLAHLGLLVRRSLQQSEKPSDLLVALQAGTPQLGGADPAHRLAAAKLLLAASLPDEASAFLPPLEEALTATDAAVINVHGRHAYLAGVQKENAALLLKAWELTQAVLNLPGAKEFHAVCIARSIALAPRIPRETAGEWCRRVFHDDPATGLTLLLNTTQQLTAAFASDDAALRVKSLELQRLFGEELLAARGDDLQDWSVALEMLTRGWINEAQKTAGGPLRKMTTPRDEEISALPIAPLLESAPGTVWLAALGRDTADHARHLIGLFAARSGDDGAALNIIREIVKRDADVARQLAEELITAGGGESEEEYEDDPYSININSRALSRMSPSQRMRYLQMLRQQQHSDGESREPLTRAGQLRRLARLRELLAEFQAAGVPALSEASRVAAFASCHSPAEVYRAQDIEAIFGPVNQLAPESALALAQSLREGLAQTWRDPDVQRQQGTNRTPSEQAAEIVRGYALATDLLKHASDRDPENADLLAALGGVHFDLAEFLYGQQADLATYAQERDAAFRAFEKGAQAYDRSLASLPPEEYSVDLFRQWFQAALGASDLAYLTRQDEPDETQVQKIAAALGGLHQSAPRHQELFADSIFSSLEEAPPNLKPHLVRQALVIAGDHPAARPLAERLAVYDDLLKEVELRLTIDGSEQVGHERPFGVRVSLAGTQAVLRENDAFPALLIPTVAMAGQPADPSHPRQRLEDEMREKLSQAFQIEAVAFHPPATRPRSFGREGWQELPVAYVVLRANDKAIDRLPPIQFDLEFADGDGEVRLPVRSQVVLLDADSQSTPLRPNRDVNVRQLLDDRDLAKGILRLEVAATARGVVPELAQLLKSPSAIPGFQAKQTVEQGLSVTSLEAGEQVDALTERRWLIELAPLPGEAPTSFEFPAPADEAYAVSFQRYGDADIVDAAASAPLQWPVMSSAGRWIWPLAGAAVVVLAAALLAVLVLRRKPMRISARTFTRPEQLTPFSLIGLLRRIESASELPLNAADRQDLSDTIERLEDQFFRRGESEPAADLDSIAGRWLSRVSALARAS